MNRSNNNTLSAAAKSLAVAILVDQLGQAGRPGQLQTFVVETRTGRTAGGPSLVQFARAEFVELAEASGLTPEQCGTILRDECHRLAHA